MKYIDPRPNPKTGLANEKNHGRSKLQEPDQAWVPDACPAWAQALLLLDQHQFRGEPWRWYVPEPALVLGSERDERRNKYLRNWIQLREAWIYCIRNPPLLNALPALSAQEWRVYLLFGPDAASSEETKNAARINRVSEYFRQVFKAEIPNSDHLTYFGEEVPSEVPVKICKKIAWELYELGFRQGLIRLDRVLCPATPTMEFYDEGKRTALIAAIFPDGHADAISDLPKSHEGLAATHIRDRAKSLEALRQVLRRWPDVPANIKFMPRLDKGCNDATLALSEGILAQYYCQTYWSRSGRVPVLPRRFPLP